MTDPLATWLIRPMSYSQFSSWDYDRDQWYSKYILGVTEESSPAMVFGNLVGDSIGTANSMVPMLVPPGVKEYEMRATLGDIRIVGYADHYCTKTKVLHENKTSQNTKRWDQKSVDKHTQLDMYALLLFLQDNVKPEEVEMQLNYIPVVQKQDFTLSLPDPIEVYSFKTRRTTRDITKYAQYIQETRKEMQSYAQARLAKA